MPLDDRFFDDHPDFDDRQEVPQEAMEYWSVRCWQDWITSSTQVFLDSKDRVARKFSFVPIVMPDDNFGPREVQVLLKTVLTGSAFARFSEGVSRALQSVMSDEGANYFTFLLGLSAYTSASIDTANFVRVLQRLEITATDEEIKSVGNALSLLIVRRLNSVQFSAFYNEARDFISKSPSAVCMVTSKIAASDPKQYLPALRDLYPAIFEKPSMHSHWRYAVNKLLGTAGVVRSLESVFSESSTDSKTLYDALISNRIIVAPYHWESKGLDNFAFDRVTKKYSKIPKELREIFLSFSEASEKIHINAAGSDFQMYPSIVVEPDGNDYFEPESQLERAA